MSDSDKNYNSNKLADIKKQFMDLNEDDDDNENISESEKKINLMIMII